MRVTFKKELPKGFSAENLEYGKNVFFRNDMLGWLRETFGSRYYTSSPAYSYATGRKVWGKRASDGKRCLVAEVRHVPEGGCFHDVPSLATLAKMRARMRARMCGEAAIMRGDGTVFWAAMVGGKLVTRTGVAA